MKDYRWREKIAKEICDKYLQKGTFNISDAPDLINENDRSAVEITEGWGGDYCIQENVTIPQYFKDNPNAILARCRFVSLADFKEFVAKETNNIVAAINKKCKMDYGNKYHSKDHSLFLFVFTNYPLDDKNPFFRNDDLIALSKAIHDSRWKQRYVCDVYDHVILYSHRDARLLIIDLSRDIEHYQYRFINTATSD